MRSRIDVVSGREIACGGCYIIPPIARILPEFYRSRATLSGVTATITPPLTPPQIALLQKPPENALQAEPAPPTPPRGAPAQPGPGGRGRLLDILI
jgi:hypothetical protein